MAPWKTVLKFFYKIYHPKHKRRVENLFYSKISYKNDKAKEAQALKSRPYSASFPCPGEALNGREP